MLSLTSGTVNDIGYYRCRANNDQGSVYSSVATVMVKGDLNSNLVFFSNNGDL